MDVEGSDRGLISGICLEKERDYENQNYVFEIRKKKMKQTKRL